MPNRIVNFLYGLVGLTWAYDTAEGVSDAIAEQSAKQTATRTTIHVAGAAKLTGPDSFQPGLIDLHGELHDGWIYLKSLESQARQRGHGDLATRLADAAAAMVDAMKDVGLAATATVPPVPVTQ